MVFLPSDEKRAQLAIDSIENIINSEMQELITWRDVPVDSNVLGETVKENTPIIKQFFVKMGSNVSSENEFLRKLYVIRNQSLHTLEKNGDDWSDFYIVSLSTRTIIFKGMVLAPNLSKFYLDFQNPNFKSAIALFIKDFLQILFLHGDLLNHLDIYVIMVKLIQLRVIQIG